MRGSLTLCLTAKMGSRANAIRLRSLFHSNRSAARERPLEALSWPQNSLSLQFVIEQLLCEQPG
jgi:hypothetical protein